MAVPPAAESHPPEQQGSIAETAAAIDESTVTQSLSTQGTPSQQQAQPVQKQGTAIPIPRPKRRASISESAPTPITVPVRKPSPAIDTSAPPPDTPASPHTLPTEPTLVPSIESDVEQIVARDVAAEAPSAHDPISAPVPTPPQTQAPQDATGKEKATSVQRPAKRAKKTNEITKSKEWSQWQAPLTPSSQAAGASVEGPGETSRASVASSSAVSSTPEPRRASTASKRRKTSKSGPTDGDGSEKTKKQRRRRREPTPDGAETVEILPNVIKMSELCKDLKTGKKSQREAEIRKWEAEQSEKKNKPQDTESIAGTPKKSNGGTAEPEPESQADNPGNAQSSAPAQAPEKPVGPVMRIVNGEIVLDASSLEVDRHADAERNAGELESVEENQFSRRVNQATWGKRSKTQAWDEERTDLFYRGLRMFGTDFMVISKLFPGRSRHQIKLKFNNEERKDPQRIKDTLFGPREVIDIDTYSQMTNATYDDPRLIEEELDEEKKKIEAEHEKEKRLQEGMMRNTSEAGGENGIKGDNHSNVQSKTKKRNITKKPQTLGGGTEEVLGSI